MGFGWGFPWLGGWLVFLLGVAGVWLWFGWGVACVLLVLCLGFVVVWLGFGEGFLVALPRAWLGFGWIFPQQQSGPFGMGHLCVTRMGQ